MNAEGTEHNERGRFMNAEGREEGARRTLRQAHSGPWKHVDEAPKVRTGRVAAWQAAREVASQRTSGNVHDWALMGVSPTGFWQARGSRTQRAQEINERGGHRTQRAREIHERGGHTRRCAKDCAADFRKCTRLGPYGGFPHGFLASKGFTGTTSRDIHVSAEGTQAGARRTVRQARSGPWKHVDDEAQNVFTGRVAQRGRRRAQ